MFGVTVTHKRFSVGEQRTGKNKLLVEAAAGEVAGERRQAGSSLMKY